MKNDSRHRRSKRARQLATSTGQSESADAASALPPGRRALFRLLALLLPLLVLCLLEVGLRLIGYGYPTWFFRKIRVNNHEFLIQNDKFSSRFFSPELARWPTSFIFPKDKPPGVLRIFILGESAAMGDPQPAFSAARYMEVLLKERFPQKRFEVINTGITAINSHVILPIARACAAEQGDIWIIYMGNNEMVGPFGAATIFGARAPPRALVRIILGLQQTRVGQMFTALTRRLARKSAHASWGGMQMFLQNQIPPGDQRKETVYKNFDSNLRDIVRVGLGSGVNVILNTMSVNLKDCPSFASLNSSNLPATDRAQFEKLYSDAVALDKEGRFAEATPVFEQAAKIDPHFSELQFRWAHSLLHLTNAAASEHFQLACDNDALPFRADSRINALIRQVAAQQAARPLVLCDAQAALHAHSPVKISGDESFFEHVHFRFEGNYVLGRLWAEQVRELLPDARAANEDSGWASQEMCDRQLGLSVWNRVFVLDSVISRMRQPPLSSQFNNSARLELLQAETQKLRQRQAEPGALAKARQEFEVAIQRSPNDPYLHESYANFLESIHDPKQAIGEYRKIVEHLPQDYYSSLQLGRLLGEQGQLTEAESFLGNATGRRPTLPEGWYELGNVTAAQGKFADALACYDRASRLRPRDATYVCYKGKVLAKLNRRYEAVQLYRQAVQLRPEYWEAHFELAGELVAQNQIKEAMLQYVEVTRLNPRHALTRVNLGTLFVRQNQLDEAIDQFQIALQIDPVNKFAQDYLEQVRKLKSQKR